MKYLANIITISRILLSLLLLFLFNNTLLFIIIYLICGLSDILDGFIARKTKTSSELGAKLDSLADLVFFFIIIISISIWLQNDIFKYLPLIITTALIRMFNIIFAYFKYHSFAILHTYSSKLMGLLLFISPLIILSNFRVLLYLFCLYAIFSALEETIIHLTSKKLNLNRKSFFIKKD